VPRESGRFARAREACSLLSRLYLALASVVVGRRRKSHAFSSLRGACIGAHERNDAAQRCCRCRCAGMAEQAASRAALPRLGAIRTGASLARAQEQRPRGASAARRSSACARAGGRLGMRRRIGGSARKCRCGAWEQGEEVLGRGPGVSVTSSAERRYSWASVRPRVGRLGDEEEAHSLLLLPVGVPLYRGVGARGDARQSRARCGVSTAAS
jgi:hypothetical protein